MADNLGPASVVTEMKYQAPNPSAPHGSPLMTLLVAGGVIWALFTPTGQQDVAKVKSYIQQKFNLGGATTSGS
ncbi:hypothetical protein [Sulfobacillus harzensis]|uniref:Uncharacterized protein n=1 Tax=Sulfobacillus harzensis TaxID=2729629 RepID=A0A7Y0L2Q9_9FIRM|nr:hypothetical protein [Sulfobacillus harzensis]NMP22212.1 hypothetical protein [Sulfobacillus harzensis]